MKGQAAMSKLSESSVTDTKSATGGTFDNRNGDLSFEQFTERTRTMFEALDPRTEEQKASAR